MKELKDVLGMVAEGLKSFAEGMGMIAGKVDALAASLVEAETKPRAPEKKAAKAKPEKVKKTAARKPAPRASVTRPAKKSVLKAAPKKTEPVTASSAVLEAISKAGDGLDTAGIMEKRDLTRKRFPISSTG